MYREKTSLELTDFFQIIKNNKYKILIFTLISVIITNIYFLDYQNKYSAKKSFSLKSNVKMFFNELDINKYMRDFVKKYKNFEGGEVAYFYSQRRYFLTFAFKDKNKEKILNNMEQITNIFDEKVMKKLYKDIEKNKEKVYNEVSPVKQQLKEYNNRIDEIEDLIAKDLTQATNTNKIENLKKIKNALIEESSMLSKSNSNLLMMYNFYKKHNKIDKNSIFNIEEKFSVYSVSKVKFFVFSVIFSLIMSITFILLFSSKVKK